MAVDDRLERFSDVGRRVDVVELAGGDDRREQGPVFCPDFMTGEERIFSGQADWPDGVLDRVGVEVETPIFEEARQPLPMIERKRMSSASVEPLEIIDSCFSNHDFNAVTKGSECALRAANRMSGDEPRTMASIA